jgi:hypothetical protein
VGITSASFFLCEGGYRGGAEDKVIDAAEAIHRALIILGLGVVFLALAALQIWAGKAFTGYGPGIPPWITRKKYPKTFWYYVSTCSALGLSLVGAALTRLI